MADDHATPQPGAPRLPIDPTGTSTPPPPPPGYVPAVYVQHPGSGKGATKIILYLLAVGLLVSITVNVYLAGPVAAFMAAFSSSAPPETAYNPAFTPSNDKERVVVVEIAGLIDGAMAEYARQAFYTLEKDPPAAVVLRVESGGGGVTASDQIWRAVTSFKAEHPNVPVIASFGIAAASGGYYISAPTDYIFAERTTVTGSIGVYVNLPAAGALIEKLGVEMNMVIADESPAKDDANNLFIQWYDDEGNLTQEGQDSLRVVKNLVNRSYDTFLEVVQDGRTTANNTITKSDMKAAANGAIFIGQEALDAKLVDEIGYLDDAIAYAAAQASISGEPRVTMIRKPVPGLLGSLASGKKGVDLSNITGDELRELVDDVSAIKLEYRMRIR